MIFDNIVVVPTIDINGGPKICSVFHGFSWRRGAVPKVIVLAPFPHGHLCVSKDLFVCVIVSHGISPHVGAEKS